MRTHTQRTAAARRAGFRTERIVFKGGTRDGWGVHVTPQTKTWTMADETYKRTGEVLAGVAVFRWEGEL